VGRWTRAANGIEKAGSFAAWAEPEDARAFSKRLAREEREYEDRDT
jgi:hypothetical protein